MIILPDVIADAVVALFASAGGYAISAARNYRDIDNILTGRWEGNLISADQKYPSQVIRCSLILARPQSRSNSGFLFYERVCTSLTQYLITGIDELNKYSIDREGHGFKVEMQFIRKLHKHIDNTLSYEMATTTMICNCDSRKNRNPILHVSASFDDRKSQENDDNKNMSVWKGDFTKS